MRASEAQDAAQSAEAERRYEIHRPHVLDELIDDELVIINFDTGKYHGIRGAGVDIWRLLDAGHSVTEVTEWLALRHAGVDERASRAIECFVSELERQHLIVTRAGDAPLCNPGESAGAGGARMPFRAPELDTRDDLQDYLALDPIHDVDERGWPNARR